MSRFPMQCWKVDKSRYTWVLRSICIWTPRLACAIRSAQSDLTCTWHHAANRPLPLLATYHLYTCLFYLLPGIMELPASIFKSTDFMMLIARHSRCFVLLGWWSKGSSVGANMTKLSLNYSTLLTYEQIKNKPQRIVLEVFDLSA